jgi:hypothetical protein
MPADRDDDESCNEGMEGSEEIRELMVRGLLEALEPKLTRFEEAERRGKSSVRVAHEDLIRGFSPGVRLVFRVLRKCPCLEKDPPPSLLFHYTTVEGLLGILRSNSIRAGEIRCMNDDLERGFGLTQLATICENLVREFGEAGKRVTSAVQAHLESTWNKDKYFLACFSALGNSRLLLNRYGPRDTNTGEEKEGEGCCIVFSTRRIKDVGSSVFSRFARVRYGMEIQEQHSVLRLREICRQARREPDFTLDLVSVDVDFGARLFGDFINEALMIVKDDYWAPEREWRFICPELSGASLQLRRIEALPNGKSYVSLRCRDLKARLDAFAGRASSPIETIIRTGIVMLGMELGELEVGAPLPVKAVILGPKCPIALSAAREALDSNGHSRARLLATKDLHWKAPNGINDC